VFGTLSLVAALTEQGHLKSFDETLDKLREAGLYVSEPIVEAVRRGLRTGS
jgi:predicted nucleic acid-binding protein